MKTAQVREGHTFAFLTLEEQMGGLTVTYEQLLDQLEGMTHQKAADFLIDVFERTSGDSHTLGSFTITRTYMGWEIDRERIQIQNRTVQSAG